MLYDISGVRMRDPSLAFEPEEAFDITGQAAPPPAAPALFAAGRALGLALLHAQPLGLRFAPALLRILTNEPLQPTDVKRIDPTFYTNCLERAARPGGVAALAELWCSDAVLFLSGGVDGEPLCDGGGSRVVTEDNKSEWLRLMAEHRYLLLLPASCFLLHVPRQLAEPQVAAGNTTGCVDRFGVSYRYCARGSMMLYHCVP